MRTRCMFSCLPFWCGLAGSMNSGMMPRRMNQTERRDSRPSALEAKGVPLSERNPFGKAVLAEEAAENGSCVRE